MKKDPDKADGEINHPPLEKPGLIEKGINNISSAFKAGARYIKTGFKWLTIPAILTGSLYWSGAYFGAFDSETRYKGKIRLESSYLEDENYEVTYKNEFGFNAWYLETESGELRFETKMGSELGRQRFWDNNLHNIEMREGGKWKDIGGYKELKDIFDQITDTVASRYKEKELKDALGQYKE
ncbi:MAG: hypothetical protein SVV03_03945 [Candidatus Nanohaloarchaea archaeon]|nr:hypothetical protein [Candidatus Nanohaloarchaea archaeon]